MQRKATPMENVSTQVVFSENAYLGIIAETYEKVGTETGGIFLGKYYQGKWYILETLDPGPNSIFRPAYFEYDHPYVNHLANKTARFYKNGLDLIGLWHRHPGSFSSFSSTDDSTNLEYAKICTNGAISVLVNLDPEFRMTVYHVSPSLNYNKLNFLVGSSYIPQEILEKNRIADFVPTKSITHHLSPKLTEHRAERIKNDRVDDKRVLSIWERVANAFRLREQKVSSNNGRDKKKRTPVMNNIDFQSLLLGLVEEEINYLESQSDYNFSLKIIDDYELLVTMNYIRKMHNYPSHIRMIFGITKEQTGYVKANQKIYRYFPGFIKMYLAKNIYAE